ncbi:DUF89-domain-containing protein [Mycena leptocephala]|nr:DUF89-domain-containing protein [Mycena leptocephala]
MFVAPYPPPHLQVACKYTTVVHRWPVIITGHDLSLEMNVAEVKAEKESLKLRIDEAQGITSRLKYEMGKNYHTHYGPIASDGKPSEMYNSHLQRLAEDAENTGFTAPWLLQKHAKLKSDSEKLGVLFKEMIQMGNATDLSLLTHLSASNVEHLQTAVKDAQAVRSDHVKPLSNGTLDFSLFTDLVFVTYTPLDSRVLTPGDFTKTIHSLLDPASLPPPPGMEVEHPQTMIRRWEKYVDGGIFALSVPATIPLGGGSDGAARSCPVGRIWTSPPNLDMEVHASSLWNTLRTSAFVIFKLLQALMPTRCRLTGDVQWPAWTSLSTALGPLAGSFSILRK